MNIQNTTFVLKLNTQSFSRKQQNNPCSALNSRKADTYTTTNVKNIAFKGKLDSFKSFLSKIFPKKIITPVQELTHKAENIVKIKPVLPFDGAQRLKNLGVSSENIHSFLDTANGNKEHFYKLVRMYKDGIDEKSITEIFNTCKTHSGKVSVPFYNTALALKELKVEDELISVILKKFRLSSTKFDLNGFLKFQNLKSRAFDENKMPKKAFSKLSQTEISSYFYNNIDNILQAKELFGENNFIKLYNFDNKHIKKVIDKTPFITKSLKTHKNLYKLFKEKMNPSTYTIEVNYGLSEVEHYSPQAQTAFHNRLSTFFKISDLIERTKGQIDNYDEKIITKLLEKLPSD